MDMSTDIPGMRAGIRRLATEVALACAAALLCGGCSVVGMGRREPMVEVRDIPYDIPAGGRVENEIADAAIRAGWSASVMAPGRVRCTRTAALWQCTVDVLCGPAGFSIAYVESNGMNYTGDGTIHPGYNKQVFRLRTAISNALGQRRGAAVAVQPQVAPYELKSFTRDLAGSYRFEFALRGAGGVDVLARIKEELRRLVLADCRDDVQPGTERLIDFPEFSQTEGRITGRAVLKTVQVVEEQEFIFDPELGVGRMVVAYAPGRIVDARNWARDNIARRMKDKHGTVLSRLGVEPHYTIEGERSFDEGGKKKIDVRFRLVQ